MFVEIPELRPKLEILISSAAVNDARRLMSAVIATSRRSYPIANDRELVLLRTFIPYSGMLLQYATLELRGDRDIVLMAVNNNGLALQFAARELQSDFKVVMSAVRQNPGAVKYASKGLQRDDEIVLALVGENLMLEDIFT